MALFGLGCPAVRQQQVQLSVGAAGQDSPPRASHGSGSAERGLGSSPPCSARGRRRWVPSAARAPERAHFCRGLAAAAPRIPLDREGIWLGPAWLPLTGLPRLSSHCPSRTGLAQPPAASQKASPRGRTACTGSYSNLASLPSRKPMYPALGYPGCPSRAPSSGKAACTTSERRRPHPV